jgi:hypothetical protein
MLIHEDGQMNANSSKDLKLVSVSITKWNGVLGLYDGEMGFVVRLTVCSVYLRHAPDGPVRIVPCRPASSIQAVLISVCLV